MKALLRLLTRLLIRPILSPSVPLALQRRSIDLAARITRTPAGVTIDQVELGGVPVEVIRPGGLRHQRAVLYLHGGAFITGSPRSHRAIAAHLAVAAGADVFVPDYRLAPESPYPAAPDDAFSAYRALLADDYSAGSVALAGDSAGAGLAVSTAIAIANMDAAAPAALVLLCPWVDLTLSGESVRTNAKRDAILRPAWLASAVPMYAGGLAPRDPRLSPLFGDIRALPPTLVQVAGDDPLLDDGLRLARRAEAGGVEVTLQRFDGLWHGFQAHAGALDQADAAIESAAMFLRQGLTS